VYDYWHQRWVEYLNQHYKDRFVQAGVVDVSFTEKCPDCPDGSGAFHYQFASDGTLEFTHHEGGAIIEYDSYDIGYRLLGDANYDAMEQLENGAIRYSKNLGLPLGLAYIVPANAYEASSCQRGIIPLVMKKIKLPLPSVPVCDDASAIVTFS
jgi:hypothetical protein